MFYPSLSLAGSLDDCRSRTKKRSYFVSLSVTIRFHLSSSGIPGFGLENHKTSSDTRRIICF
jgi:hypothetical protein